MTGFEKPHVVTGADSAFGAAGSMDQLLPRYDDIPEDFRRERGKARRWVELQQRWFFSGLPKETEFVPKEGIDVTAALRHLSAIQRSFDPKHEHKEAGVAYLMSLWFDDVKVPGEAEGSAS